MSGPPQKSSGIKPPSKFGRLYDSQHPRPAEVPAPPISDTATTPFSNMMGLARKKSTLDELEDYSMSSSRRDSTASDRKSSLGSDSLWGDARKLSEAGVRRTSDSSVVLTEDTDSFIIGERVWVGGTKPGTIAYIGDTQFAPGEWAGVVLDQPIGKNDGSVSNIRYFQCEVRKGVFSRLTRLTRVPLVEPSSLLGTSSVAGTGNGLSSSSRTLASPSHSHKTSSPPPATPVPSRPPSAASGRELKAGDRVIVMSSTGSKTGILRYVGTTTFAPGEWCGVECDDPIGKNDGSVQGQRYFTCKPKHGLFAPLAKVSLSPSPNRRPSCAMHSAGLVRQNTNTSLSSTASSVSRVSSIAKKPSRPSITSKAASVSTNEALLKDKEVYIEQLLKERDLERLAVTRAAGQAEEAERNQDILKQQLREVQEVSESTQADLLHQLSELRRENKDLNNQLDDCRAKLDDCDFRFEEERVSKAELQAEIDSLNNKFKNELLSKEKEYLELSFKQKESVEILSDKTKLEEDIIKKDSVIAALSTESNVLKQKLNSLDEESSQLLKKCESIIIEKNKFENDVIKIECANNELKAELNDTVQKLNSRDELVNQLQNELKSLHNEKSSLQDNTVEKDSVIIELKFKLDEVNRKVQLQIESEQNMQCKLDELKHSYDNSQEKLETVLRSEAELKKQLGENVNKFAEMEDQFQKRITIIGHEQDDLLVQINKCNNIEKNLRLDLEEKQKLQSSLNEQIAALTCERQELANHLDREKSRLGNELEILKSTKEEQNNMISEKDKTIANLEEEQKILNHNIEQLKITECSLKNELVQLGNSHDELKVKFKNDSSSDKKLLNQFEEFEKESKLISSEKTKLEEDLIKKESVITELISEINGLKQKLNNQDEQLSQLQNKCENISIERNNFENDLIQREIVINKTKSELDDTIKKLKSQDQLVNQQQNELESHKKEKRLLDDNAIQKDSTIVELRCKLDEINKKLQLQIESEKNMKFKLDELKHSCDNNKEKLETVLSSEATLKKQLSENENRFGEIKDQLQQKITIVEHERDDLLVEIKKCNNIEKNLRLDLEEKQKIECILNEQITALSGNRQELAIQLDREKSRLDNELEMLKSAREEQNYTISQKGKTIANLEETINKLSLDNKMLVENVSKHENKLKEVLDEYNKSKLTVLSAQKSSGDAEKELLLKLDELNSSKASLESTLHERDCTIQDLRSSVDKLDCELNSAVSLVANKESLINEFKSSCSSKESHIIEMQASNSIAEGKVKDLQQDIITNRTQYQQELCNIKSEKEALERKLRESEEKLNEERKMVHELKSNKKSASDAVQTKSQEIDALKSKIMSLTDSLKVSKQITDENDALKKHMDVVLQENKQLRSQLSNNTSINNNTSEEIDKDMHINFLNELVGDMQRKLQKKEEEIKQLENGEQSGPVRSERAAAPRLFCDICDVFDLHDTDDCPRQAMDSPPPQQTRSSVPQSYERPYCETCEMFGHETGECEEETY